MCGELNSFFKLRADTSGFLTRKILPSFVPIVIRKSLQLRKSSPPVSVSIARESSLRRVAKSASERSFSKNLSVV